MITKIIRGNNAHIDSSSVSKLKAQAKKLKRAENITHTEALEKVAKKFGFDNWHQVIDGNKVFHETERYFNEGIFAVFNLEDAMEIFDTKFYLTEDELAEVVIHDAYYQYFIHLIEEDDEDNRQLKDIYSEEELKEIFDNEISSKKFYRINFMIPGLSDEGACYSLNTLLDKATFKLPALYIVKGKFLENDYIFDNEWFEDDESYLPEHWPENQTNIVSGICIDPNLPQNFENKDNSLRTKLEIQHWWNRPFIRTIGENDETQYLVRVLDGGAWDRSTNHGVSNDLDSAIAKALSLTKN